MTSLIILYTKINYAKIMAFAADCSVQWYIYIVNIHTNHTFMHVCVCACIIRAHVMLPRHLFQGKV